MPEMWGNLQPSGWVCPKCSVVRSSLQNSNQNVSRNQRNENLANRHVLLHDSNILSGVKSYFIHLCDPDDTNSFVQRCSVHVDRGTQRKDKTTDPLVDSVIFFHTAYGGWQSRSAAEKRSQVSQVYLAQFLQQYNTIRYLYLNIIQYNTIQYNTIQYLYCLKLAACGVVCNGKEIQFSNPPAERYISNLFNSLPSKIRNWKDFKQFSKLLHGYFNKRVLFSPDFKFLNLVKFLLVYFQILDFIIDLMQIWRLLSIN